MQNNYDFLKISLSFKIKLPSGLYNQHIDAFKYVCTCCPPPGSNVIGN